MIGEIDTQRLGRSMHALATELFPLNRSLTGPGYRKTLEILERVTGPMERHVFRSGEAVLDWNVPKEWTLRDAWIKGPRGEKVVDLADSNLHVVSYSRPVSERMPLESLQQHLHSLPDQPEAIPYRTSYYSEDWGFCLEERQRSALDPGDYEVMIDSDLTAGSLILGEVVVPGESEQEVLLSTYCCHPSLANNELSGPVVVAHLAALLRDSMPRLTYRLLFIPETIGAIAYLAQFGERLKERLQAGYVVTCAGDEGNFTYKRSRRGDSLADRAAEHVLEHLAEPHETLDFFPTGSDERQYCSPGYNLPVGSLMRTMYGRYPEYHTSLDDLELITPAALGGTLAAYAAIVDTLEANVVLAATHPFGEPQLSPRGLYPTVGGGLSGQRRLESVLALLNYCDGTNDLLAVAQRARQPVRELWPLAVELIDHGLLSRSAAVTTS